ncbi:MAG: diguanylate cyclase domain-containing protein, partial [Christensenellales bacterium]
MSCFGVGFFPFAMLLVIYCSAINRYEKHNIQHKAFLYLLLNCMLMVFVDALAWLCDGGTGGVSAWMVYAINTVLFILTPGCIFLLYYYVCVQITTEGAKRLKWAGVFVPLHIVIVGLVLLNLWTGWLFSVDAAAYYVRGDYFGVFAVLCYAELALTHALLIRNHRNIPSPFFMTLVLAPVLPMVGQALQILVVEEMWGSFSMSLAILLIYLNIQNQFTKTDYLTGLNNRRQLDDYISYRIKSGGRRPFSVVLIDLNQFKRINDTLGHNVGDQAIMDAATLLKQCIRQGDFIAR